mgnify:FL=1
MTSNQPIAFKAKRASQCADGSFIYDWCQGIKPGDVIVRRSEAALFDRPGRGRGDASPYYELWYSHLVCWQETQREQDQTAIALWKSKQIPGDPPPDIQRAFDREGARLLKEESP